MYQGISERRHREALKKSSNSHNYIIKYCSLVIFS